MLCILDIDGSYASISFMAVSIFIEKGVALHSGKKYINMLAPNRTQRVK